jgi:hypothetical protein
MSNCWRRNSVELSSPGAADAFAPSDSPASSFRHEFNKLDEGHHIGNEFFPCGVMGAT